MKKLIYLVPVISASIFFYLGKNSNVEEPKIVKEITNVQPKIEKKLPQKIEIIEDENYTLEDCRKEIGYKIPENDLKLAYKYKLEKYKNNKKIDCESAYALDVRMIYREPENMEEFERKYGHLKGYAKYRKKEELFPYVRPKKPRIEIPDYEPHINYDYDDYETKTVNLFEEIYEEKKLKLKNVQKIHPINNLEKNVKYESINKVKFNFDNFDNLIKYHIGEEINNLEKGKRYKLEDFIDFPIENINIKYKENEEEKKYKYQLKSIYIPEKINERKSYIVNGGSYASLFVNFEKKTIKGEVIFNDTKKLRIDIKNNTGYIYMYTVEELNIDKRDY